MSKPPAKRSALRYMRGLMIALALLLPTLSLAVFGTVWLWQNGLLLVWSIVASLTAVAIYAGERWLVARSAKRITDGVAAEADGPAAPPLPDGSPDAEVLDSYTALERRAWAAVEEISEKVDPDTLASRDAIIELGISTVEAVAQRMYPDEKDPLWRFTVPEALTLIGRVSDRLNGFVIDNVPLGDQLTVAQLLAIYRWRSMATVAEKAYDLWRVLRLANPATAIGSELREKLSSQLIKGMRTELTRRLAQTYVREVGRAAIDLYSGRLRPDLVLAAERSRHEVSAPERAAVRVLVLGQAGVGKSSLVNAMAGETRAAVSTVPMDHAFIRHDLRHGNAEEITLIDSPALTGHEDAVAAEALTADAILWVVSATRPDRAIDAEQIARLRTLLSANIRRQPPPIILALTNIDRVRPFNEWQPPYNVAQPSTNKEHSIREALDAVTHDLAIDPDDVVPVMSASIDKAYNVDTLWAKLMEVLPEALNTQLARALDERTRSGLKWGSVWRQARNAGTTVGKAVWDSATSKRK